MEKKTATTTTATATTTATVTTTAAATTTVTTKIHDPPDLNQEDLLLSHYHKTIHPPSARFKSANQ